MDRIGLIPAAGTAKRLGSLAFSKELIPIGFNSDKQTNTLKVISAYLLEKYKTADVKKIYAIVRKGKWDILNYYGDGTEYGVQLAYLIAANSLGVPYTLDQAYPFVKTSKIFLGFPDILFEPKHAFVIIDETLNQKNADIVLGLYPVRSERLAKKCDMVNLDPVGRVTQIRVKPNETDLQFSWIIAIWKPKFTSFMHYYLKTDLRRRMENLEKAEIHVGHVIHAAIQNNLSVYGHLFSDFHFTDIGTPDDLAQAMKEQFADQGI